MPRFVYGHSHSENGWPMCTSEEAIWGTVPGAAHVHLQIAAGQPSKILRAFAADFHKYVEPLRDADSACWTPTNSVATSNHLSGTAMDLNWNGPPFRLHTPQHVAFPSPKWETIRELLDWYEGVIYWGQDWSGLQDSMHFQLNGNTYNRERTQDFIDRKIRADGFSKFRRGNEVPRGDAVQVLMEATGLPHEKCVEFLPDIREGLLMSECTNSKRIAMWLAQVGHESDNFRAQEEYKKDGRYAPFIGRTWIQVTWDYNYLSFGEWCVDNGYLTDKFYFRDNPTKLREDKWRALGPAWYWTKARPDINEHADRGDVLTVTRKINGGTNGIADRNARYKKARAVGERLMVLVEEDSTVSPELERMVREIHDALFTPRYSKSPYRLKGDRKLSLVDALWNADAFLHMDFVDNDAAEGNSWEFDRLRAVVRAQGADTSAFALGKAARGINYVEEFGKKEVVDGYKEEL